MARRRGAPQPPGVIAMSDDKPAEVPTKTQFKMLPDKRTMRFTLPNGITHDARNIRMPGPIAQACDHALKLTTMERHVLREILDKLGT